MKRRVHKAYIVAGYAFVQHPQAIGVWLRCATGRCAALVGEIGKRVACAVYPPCRG